ncbi:NAD(P)H-hydrate dehydratase [Histidinibacterium aquaticum]|uniref:Bifunctional NAD(P)H-hydrate repair enzyme n=1 Tax=Histidinibacterium aquaticum TaxID=2613962 RepID=A0A5J5GLR8_9RHOB|nr:NAD(P)H-hydrate dehydratase [Histidinibacterium aquaticum]KAA9009259.1 NAD(P)H-hydrate dehydratase [Histidinibacterium aquaticum]
MTELLTATQMQSVEKAAMEAGAVTGRALMERAGRGAVDALFEAGPHLRDRPGHAVVLCGPGNNGGDGYVVARRLADLGWTVEVFAFGDPEKLSEDATGMRALWLDRGPVGEMSAAGQGQKSQVLVDAMFGTGLGRPIPAECAEAFHAVRARPGYGSVTVLALDCPSGLSCDSGAVLVPEQAETDFRLIADLTATFHAPKRGHYLGEGPTLCGRLAVVDIGLDAEPEPGAFEMPAPDRLRLLERRGDWPAAALRAFSRSAHKYERGHVLVLGGGPGKGGASRMTARAALRIGAGLVTLAVPPGALQENAAQLDAIMLKPLRDAEALSQMLEDDRLSTLVLGPGLGKGEGTRALVRAALAAERATVLDADALTSFSEAPEALFDALHPACVLTPHEGEFARLFPDLGQKSREMAKPEAAAEAARRAGATILLKGPDTVIASPDGAVSLQASAYERSARWLGTAGAGDVLAGMIGGMLGQGTVPAHLAAEAAAWLHVEAALAFGPGLVAEDLPDMLPRVFRDLGA